MRTSTGSSSLRRAGAGVCAVACAVLLAGCGGGGSGDDAGASDRSSSPAATSPAATSPAAELSSGLLRAESFGPEATVVAVSVDQLRAGAGLASMGQDLTITPEACAAAVRAIQPSVDEYDDVAGVSATSPTGVTVEVLLRGGPTEGVADLMAGAAARCPEAQVGSPRLGTATVTFEDLPVPELGAGAAGLRYTTSVTQPDGTATTTQILLGAVEDGDRLVVLTALPVRAGAAAGAAAGADPAAFAELLQQAYEVQAEALG
jgi:hypothetical protein